MKLVRRNGYRILVGGPVPRQASAITLGKMVVVRKSAYSNDGLMAHELVHVRQFMHFGLTGFFGRYLGSYARLRFSGHGHMAAYRRIPFEVEASWLSRLHDATSLEPGVDPGIEDRDHGSAPVRVAHQVHRGPARMWRRRQAGLEPITSGATTGD